MKTLYGSIIGSNNAGVFGTIRDLIKNARTNEDVMELEHLWDKAGLGVEGFHWELSSGPIYCFGSLIVICGWDRISGSTEWDIEITRDTWSEKVGKQKRKKLIEKLEKSGHFIIDKHPKGSEHWLAKIK